MQKVPLKKNQKTNNNNNKKTLAQQAKKFKKCKKVQNPKHPGNSGHNEKTNPKDKYRKEQRFPTLRASKYLQQNYKGKLL